MRWRPSVGTNRSPTWMPSDRTISGGSPPCDAAQRLQRERREDRLPVVDHDRHHTHHAVGRIRGHQHVPDRGVPGVGERVGRPRQLRFRGPVQVVVTCFVGADADPEHGRREVRERLHECRVGGGVGARSEEDDVPHAVVTPYAASWSASWACTARDHGGMPSRWIDFWSIPMTTTWSSRTADGSNPSVARRWKPTNTPASGPMAASAVTHKATTRPTRPGARDGGARREANTGVRGRLRASDQWSRNRNHSCARVPARADTLSAMARAGPDHEHARCVRLA